MNTTVQNRTTSLDDIERIYQVQRTIENLQRAKDSTVRERIQKIKKIEKYLTDEVHQKEWLEAVWLDLHKCKEEALTTELTPILTSMKHIYKSLSSWVKDESVQAPLAMAGLSSYIRHEPKGHVMVIAPWNYPLQLAVNPLIHAIAAGNVIVLKPSEVSANTSRFLKQMITDLFDESDVAVVEGGVEETTTLLDKPFNHIFFTGSPSVGKIIMKAASKHLTSVTLELGGKSPVIIDTTIDIDKAAGKVAFGKTINAGQTCIAPDYVLIHESRLDDFIASYKKHIQQFFNAENKGIASSDEYARIINEKNFLRVKSYIDDAVQKGAKVALEGELNQENKFISPFILTNVTPEMTVMQDEIFGPVLPVMTFKDLEDVPAKIKAMEKPLAMYILSKSSKNINYLIHHTDAGGTGVNELMVTSINPHLPFGGANFSGIGKSNGKYSFIEFSNERGVVKRKWGSLKMVYPPYNGTIIKWLTKIAKL